MLNPRKATWRHENVAPFSNKYAGRLSIFLKNPLHRFLESERTVPEPLCLIMAVCLFQLCTQVWPVRFISANQYKANLQSRAFSLSRLPTHNI